MAAKKTQRKKTTLEKEPKRTLSCAFEFRDRKRVLGRAGIEYRASLGNVAVKFGKLAAAIPA
jgi:hypothetical protein